MRFLIFAGLLLFLSAFAVSQELSDQMERAGRGSIPEALIRPIRNENPRYPIDTVIGELGRGEASQEAYDTAYSIIKGLLDADRTSAALSSIHSGLLDNYLSTLENIEPINIRIGGGREEVDGAVSFLVRFIGRELAVTGELYIRAGSASGTWTFEELLLEEIKDRETENRESIYRYDFNPYERFY